MEEIKHGHRQRRRRKKLNQNIKKSNTITHQRRRKTRGRGTKGHQMKDCVTGDETEGEKKYNGGECKEKKRTEQYHERRCNGD